MPIFEYKCNSCAAKFDFFYKSSKNSEKLICPICKSDDVTKLISAPFVKTQQENGQSNDFIENNPPPCVTSGTCSASSCDYN